MKLYKHANLSAKTIAVSVTAFAAVGIGAVVIPNTPLVAQLSAKPMVMLVAGKDHKLFYEAYNDTSDIDGDGVLDIGFIPNNPNIIYYGLFDPKVCYTHNDAGDNTGLFTPSTSTSNGKCSGTWSGLWLNYVTTSRMDSLRKVLYGGQREVDTNTRTILRRAYIPADAHSWGKEYTSVAVNGYDIRDYTPLALPNANTRHFFGSLTANYSQNCSTLNDCSDMPPLLRLRENVGSNKRIWEWASKERPVLSTSLASGSFPTGTGAERNFTVRVEVCTATFNSGCKLYPNGTYKPVGLLHDYGENDSMLFGLLTGSYDNHMSGGRLRKVVSSFKDEVVAANGKFTSGAKIVNSFNSIRVRGFNQSSNSSEYWKSNPYTDSAKAATEGQLVDWGNPIGEMLYEGVRYFSGKGVATSAFNTATTQDTAVGLSSATWDDPFSATSAAKAPRCARSSFLTISDIDPSFDSDKVPGNSFGGYSGDITALNVTNELNTITATETSAKGNHFIGQSGAVTDNAPTVKNVLSLASIRGLAPGEPAKQGSYNAAGVAYFAKRSDLRVDSTLPAVPTGATEVRQSIDTFVVALASPLPKIAVPMPGGTVTLVPFSRTVAGSGVSATKGQYQPTNQIVDFYVETLANTVPNSHPLINGGRYKARFIINYEDVEQGGDHDMDAIAEYDVVANSDGTVSVTVTPTYQAGGMKQNMGYVISGVGTASGVYLVAQDEAGAQNYFLNVPAGRAPGYCDVATPPAGCGTLPTIGGTASTFVFSPSGTGATILNGPLWYAAKWGSFKDLNPNPADPDNAKPDSVSEWDTDGDGVPDNYFLVQNPSKLPDQLKKAFDGIAKKNSSASNVIANSSSVSNNTRVFQARFDSSYWSGDLVAYPLTASGISISVDWSAQVKLPNDTGRKLFYLRSDGQAKEFLYSNLSGTDVTDMGATATERQDVVSYLRGVRTKELQNPSGIFRNRQTLPSTVLGDIVHSSPFYDIASDTVFVGANDGMLHAFKASNGSVPGSAGTELFGFIPAQSVSRLKNLTSTAYVHDFFVDGDVVVSPKSTQTNNNSYLFAAMGRGGKGLFALDVTNPTTFSSANFLWEYTPKGSATAATDADLGLMIGRPSYVTMNCAPIATCKRSALIVGNGVNSTNGKAVLYIFLLNADGSVNSVKKLDTSAAGDNGLFAPTAFDADNNGTIDFIYAGDLKGNLWKFDVSAAADTSWGIANASSPIFVAKDSLNNLQPITAPITVAMNTVAGDTHFGKRYVFFGTGSYFRTSDPADTSVQTWYGLIDEGTTISGRASLKQRTIVPVGPTTRKFSTPVAGDMVSKQGWYIDFTSIAGERMITKSLYANLIKPALISSSIIPDVSDPCVAGGRGFVNAMDPFSGGAVTTGLFDVNGNGNFNDDGLVGSIDLGVGLTSEPIIVGDQLVVGGTSETKPVGGIKLNTGNKRKGRISWREIIKD